MKALHTPGPWIVRRMGRNTGDVFVEGIAYEGHPYFGKTNGGVEIMADDNYPTKEADARLIAAAPDLLAAAKHLFVCDMPDELEHLCKGCIAAHAAIAKATGEPQ